MRAPVLRAAAALVAVGLLVTGCAGGDASDGTRLVGVAMPTTASDRWIADGENVEAQLTALGYDVDLEYAEDDVATQVEQITAMIEAGADALVIAAVDGTKLTGVLVRRSTVSLPAVRGGLIGQRSGAGNRPNG